MIEATAKEAEAAPEVQDDFDIGEQDEATLEVKDRPEVQVRCCGGGGEAGGEGVGACQACKVGG